MEDQSAMVGARGNGYCHMGRSTWLTYDISHSPLQTFLIFESFWMNAPH